MAATLSLWRGKYNFQYRSLEFPPSRVPRHYPKSFIDSFAVVEHGVYYIHGDWMGKAAVLFYDFATGNTKVVAQMEKPSFRGIAISPDRRYVLLTQIVHAASDLMLVDNFRNLGNGK